MAFSNLPSLVLRPGSGLLLSGGALFKSQTGALRNQVLDKNWNFQMRKVCRKLTVFPHQHRQNKFLQIYRIWQNSNPDSFKSHGHGHGPCALSPTLQKQTISVDIKISNLFLPDLHKKKLMHPSSQMSHCNSCAEEAPQWIWLCVKGSGWALFWQTHRLRQWRFYGPLAIFPFQTTADLQQAQAQSSHCHCRGPEDPCAPSLLSLVSLSPHISLSLSLFNYLFFKLVFSLNAAN